MNSIEVCFSPALFRYKTTSDNCCVVVVDVLRATTAFCAAFDSGISTIIPVPGLEELKEFKHRGDLTAAERDGKKVDFAEFGNSPSVFLRASLTGRNLAYSTTNGTQAVEMAKASGCITAASFSNLSAISGWLSIQQKDIVILCSGWKNTFSLEDSLCAGALVEILEETGKFARICDAAEAALNLWNQSKQDLPGAVKSASHYQRLLAMGLNEDLRYCFLLNTSKAIPVWDGIGFRDISVNQDVAI
ncbi:MAG: 2-phosphosulfolactate phosphatase [Bacteroidota bacterium]